MPIVTLLASTDYLKRIDQVVSTTNQGITAPELASAVASATADVWTVLVEVGFADTDLAGFTSESNTPANVVEAIKLLASARVWARMLKMYQNEGKFDETEAHGLLEMANEIMESISRSRILIKPSDLSVIRATGASQGKGCPKFGVPVKQMVTDEVLNNFIEEFGPTVTKGQSNPFAAL